MQDKRLESQQYFLMFGGGSRLCPGKELGIVEITTFIHYFVTRYRYDTQFSLIVFFKYLISFICFTWYKLMVNDAVFCTVNLPILKEPKKILCNTWKGDCNLYGMLLL